MLCIVSKMGRSTNSKQVVKDNDNKKSRNGNITTLDFKKEIVERLTNIAKKNGVSTRKYGMDLLEWNVAKLDLMKNFFPFLSKSHVGNRSVFIVDDEVKDQTVEVRLEQQSSDGNDKKLILKCLHCKKTNCLHVEFAFMLPELGKLGMENAIIEANQELKTMITAHR